ncbi:TBC1 domain family member 20 [Cimex lectularius]|uniref:Rab-GAP TBC domain-containing protein n=1 Tax=Cimex lectularius TaxID=79782 RepID=A0A8I6S852_CIMLE|nr:TBC1 domain family member 20 [Cimex lectularius]
MERESMDDDFPMELDEENGFSLVEKPLETEPTELNFKEGPLSAEFRKKANEILEYLSKNEVKVEKLREYALSKGGFVCDDVRKIGWSRLLEIDPNPDNLSPNDDSLRSHSEFTQVELDVNRSLKRFPPGIPYEQRVALQDQLTDLILKVITKYPHLKYYQGYHDVAITFLLVVGEEMAFRIMERLSTEHLKDFMEPTMEKTQHLLNYIYPLMDRLNPKVCSHVQKSGAGTMFCLPWFLTWFGHSLNHYKDVVRLYDFFLASPPMMSLYLAAAIVVYREKDLLAQDCDMASIHCFLSQLPDDLPFEILIRNAVNLYNEFPPEEVEVEVLERAKKELEERKAEEEARHKRLAKHRGHIFPRRFEAYFQRLLPNSRAQFVLLAVTVAMGIFAYLKGDVNPHVR